MNPGELYLPYDMQCECGHEAFEHWYSDRKAIWHGSCRHCGTSNGKIVCAKFKFNNLNYVEYLAKKDNLI